MGGPYITILRVTLKYEQNVVKLVKSRDIKKIRTLKRLKDKHS